MPWRGPETVGEYPSLGFLVADWIEDRCVIPDGPHIGDPFRLTDEQLRFVLQHYRLRPDAVADVDDPSSAFVYRRSLLVRPQKWGKGPLSAAMICAEADGPVLFAGWDARGEPVGRRWETPWIQVTAVSEDQTDNVWRALKPMIELGALAADLPDTGETRINLPGGGRIEPVTASARSRLGQRITFACQDETHAWLKTNGGRALADNQRRNLAGMGGRSVETTNAWDPAESSVAQATFEANVDDVYRDYPVPPPGSVRNKRERRKVLRAVYGDSKWVSLDRIDAEIEELLPRDPAQAERFFLNRIVAEGDRAFDVGRWAELAAPHPPPEGRRELVTVGFDGARFQDSTGLVATHVASGWQWVLGVWERPEGPEGEGWEVPEPEVDACLEEAMAKWKVVRLYADPPYWESAVDRWAGKWGDKKVFKWWTHRDRPMAFALRSWATAMSAGELSHDGDPTFARHVGNCRRREARAKDDDGRPMWTVRKDRPGSPNKIDLAMAGCLSWEASGDAVAAGALQVRAGSALF